MPRIILVLSSMAAALLLVGGLAVGQEEAKNPAVLVGAGDIASCTRNGHEETADLLDGISGTVATFGDNAYESGTSAEFDKCYDSSWGRHKARTKPSAGDEDYKTSGAKGYFEYFGAAAGDPQEGYYSYELGSWHVVVLNSNCEEVGGCDAGSEQERWLREDLEDHPNSCTAAYFHHPRFSSGGGNSSAVRPFWEALYEADAEVVLSGHAHHYERFAPQTPSGQADPAQGIREFVVGTGGYSLNSFKSVEANSEKRISDSYGVIKLALRPEGYDWRFVTAPGGKVADSGRASCHGEPSGPPPPPPDTTAPKVTSTVPKPNATGVGPTANIKATFSEDMTAATINKTTFTLRKQGSTDFLAARVSYNPSTDRAILDPSNSLKRGATYKAAVHRGAKDLAGNQLDQNASLSGSQKHDWTFKVRN